MQMKPGSFRLVLVQMEWRRIIAWAIKQGPPLVGWWRTIYGMDIWLGRVPLIRTMIAANILVWIILWFASRRL